MIGETISHYKIVEKLGEGGMGVVYKARDLNLDRSVAIKVLPPHLSKDEEATKRFIHEAKAASALDHSHIGTIYEVDTTPDGQTFIVMAHYEGETLRQRIERGGITVEEAFEIISQIAAGLSKAHEKGIVHRDLKPSNIIFTSDGEAKIIDFGLAKLVGRTRLTKEGSTLGTAAYMSPEQAKGEEVDHRSDIFSLGAVFYELLTGKPPFRGEHEAALLYEIVHEEPEPLSTYTDILPEQLQYIIDKSLQKKVSDRYQNFGAMLKDLRLIQSGATIRDTLRISKRGALKRNVSIVGVSVVILIVVYFILSRYIAIKPSEVEAKRIMIVVLPFENVGPVENEYFTDGITDEIATRLTSIPSLGVIARTSRMQYKNTEKSIEQIAEELGVEYIVKGTVRWHESTDAPQRVRITPKLVKVSDATQIWANIYNETVNEIFQVQSSIARQVAENLNIVLGVRESSSIEYKPTDNFEAYTYYLKAREHYLRSYDINDFMAAEEFYHKAIDLDSSLAVAYAELSIIHDGLYWQAYDRSDERAAMAKQAAEKALQLEPDLSEAHLAMGVYFYHQELDYDRALQYFETALEKQPNNSVILSFVAAVQRRRGEFVHSVDTYKKAYELNPRAGYRAEELAHTLFFMRRYEEAVQYYNRSISLEPDIYSRYVNKAQVSLLKDGDVEEARRILVAVREQRGDDKVFAQIAPVWVILDRLERKYGAALKMVVSYFPAVLSSDYIYEPRALHIADLYRLMNETDSAKVYYDYALTLLTEKIKENPQDYRIHGSLGLVYAGLGRKREAMREGKLAVELMPVSKDALRGPYHLVNLAKIYAAVGEHDAAIKQIEYLLTIPVRLSTALLRIDPVWDPLRSHTRFQEVLERNSGDNQ